MRGKNILYGTGLYLTVLFIVYGKKSINKNFVRTSRLGAMWGEEGPSGWQGTDAAGKTTAENARRRRRRPRRHDPNNARTRAYHGAPYGCSRHHPCSHTTPRTIIATHTRKNISQEEPETKEAHLSLYSYSFEL